MSIVQMVKGLTNRIGKRQPPKVDQQRLIESEVTAAVVGLVRGCHDGVVCLAAIAAQHPEDVSVASLGDAVAASYGRRRGQLTLSTTVMNHPKPGLYQEIAYQLALDDDELRCRVLR